LAHFFIIGAQRSKTTYLATLLAEHPEIELASPLRPEPKFFLRPESVSLGLEHYFTRHFSNPKAGIRGEKGTSYIESEFAARQIAAHFPSARLLVCVRDPIDRAVSNFKFSTMNGFETLPMDLAFRQDERTRTYDRTAVSASPFAYLTRGLYLQQMEKYLKRFSREQIKVLQFERLGEPGVLRELFSFLGVSPDFSPTGTATRINASRGPDPELTPELESWLKDYFRESNLALEREFQLDLSNWRSQSK
jgi:hypothetical protein